MTGGDRGGAQQTTGGRERDGTRPMDATMEPVAWRQPALLERMDRLDRLDQLSKKDTGISRYGRDAQLRALRDVDPARGWYRIDGPLYSLFATKETPPCVYDPDGLEKVRDQRGNIPLAHAARLLLARASSCDEEDYQAAFVGSTPPRSASPRTTVHRCCGLTWRACSVAPPRPFLAPRS